MRRLVAGHVEMHASHMHSPLLTSPVSHVSYVYTHVMCNVEGAYESLSVKYTGEAGASELAVA